MAKRLELQVLLEGLLGSSNVYFQPPATVQMSYPCIVYERDYMFGRFADNIKYQHHKRYQVTVIDRNPDSEIPDKVANLSLCEFTRHFVTANLNHDSFNLYF